MNKYTNKSKDSSFIKLMGEFSVEQIRDGKIIDSWKDKNIVVNTGLNYILDAALSAGSSSSNFYIGLFSNNYTPIAGTLVTNLTEINGNYNESARPLWAEAGVLTQSITNTATPAVFTFNASDVVYGAFLISNSTKGGTTGTLVSASRFTNNRSMLSGDILNVVYTITTSST